RRPSLAGARLLRPHRRLMAPRAPLRLTVAGYERTPSPPVGDGVLVHWSFARSPDVRPLSITGRGNRFSNRPGALSGTSVGVDQVPFAATAAGRRTRMRR